MQNQGTCKDTAFTKFAKGMYEDFLQLIDSLTSEIEGFRSVKNEYGYGIFKAEYYQYDRLFFSVNLNLGNTVRIPRIYSLYERPVCAININRVTRKYEIFSNFTNTQKQEKNSPQEAINCIFRYPPTINDDKEILRNIFLSEFDFPISDEDIVYDFVKECYVLKSIVEQSFIEKLIPVDKKDYAEFAKYCTLSTLQNIMQSGKIRMNAITIMNDKTEVSLFDSVIKNFKEKIEKDGDEYLFGNTKFITSFTPLIDDLNMWRLYGDNAKGVCMVFKRKEGKEDNLKQVSYVKIETINKLYSFQDRLSKAGVKFCFEYLNDNKHFFKHDDYQSEKEFRLLITREGVKDWYITTDGSGNEIVSPYIDMPLNNGKEGEEYPLQLSKIILGPAMNNAVLNKYQLQSILLHRPFVKIEESSIKSYR